MKKEIWKDITGFEGKYKISSLGRVKRISHYNYFNKKGTIVKRLLEEKYLSLKINNRNYRTICLSKNGKQSYFLIHRLVALHFIPNIDNLDTVDHIDNNKENNCIDNLQWLSNLDNWKKSNMGEDNGKAKMTRNKVELLRKLHNNGQYTYKDLSEIFSISTSQVSVIINKKNWK